MGKQSHSKDIGFGFSRLLFALAILVCMTLIGYLIMVSSANSTDHAGLDLSNIQIVRDGVVLTTFEVEMMATPEQRIQGLSGREDLPAGRGMLFLFPHAANYSMWMIEMNFPLDFIFFDNELTVVHIVEDEPPCISRESCPSIFPGRAVRYILEVPAGTVAEHGIRIGDQLELPDSLPPVY